MTIEKKLMLCVAAMLAVVLSLAGAGRYSTSALGNELKQAVEVIAARAIFAGQLRADIVAMRERQRGMLMYALDHDFKRSESNRLEFLEQLHLAKVAHAAALGLANTEKGKADLGAIAADIDKYAEFFEQAWKLVDARKVPFAVALYRDFGSPIGATLENESQQFIDFQKAQLTAISADSVAQINWARWLSIIFVALGVGAVAVILLVVRAITVQLRTITTTLSDGACQIAAGSGQVFFGRSEKRRSTPPPLAGLEMSAIAQVPGQAPLVTAGFDAEFSHRLYREWL
jgi:hypothetical protein